MTSRQCLNRFSFRPATTEIEENNLGQMLMADRVQNSPYEVRYELSADFGCEFVVKVWLVYALGSWDDELHHASQVRGP